VDKMIDLGASTHSSSKIWRNNKVSNLFSIAECGFAKTGVDCRRPCSRQRYGERPMSFDALMIIKKELVFT
jgi:hypothetical protein